MDTETPKELRVIAAYYSDCRVTLIQVGQEYIVKPLNPRKKKHRGSRCEVLSIVLSDEKVKVRFLDNQSQATVDAGDLVPSPKITREKLTVREFNQKYEPHYELIATDGRLELFVQGIYAVPGVVPQTYEQSFIYNSDPIAQEHEAEVMLGIEPQPGDEFLTFNTSKPELSPVPQKVFVYLEEMQKELEQD
jgi:hypothetical protein